MDVKLLQLLSVNDENICGASNFEVSGFKIDNEHTDIVVGDFGNQMLLIVSQCEKVGSILKVVKDLAVNDFNLSEPVFSVSVIFGIDNCEQQAAARYIAEEINIEKPFVIMLNLNNYSKKIISSVISVLRSIISRN